MRATGRASMRSSTIRIPRARWRRFRLRAFLFGGFGVLLAGCIYARDVLPLASLEELTGRPARVVWIRQVIGGGNDPFGAGNHFALMGLDTRDGAGERTILGAVDNYRKPLLTADGSRIVFTDLPEARIHAVHWDGSGLRALGDGLAMELWRDPHSGVEWVYYVGTFKDNDTRDGYPVMRMQLDRSEVRERVWDRTETTPDNFQLSRDGARAVGLFPWNRWSVLNLETMTLAPRGKGCWTSMAPDDSYMCWAFDGAHKNLLLKKTEASPVRKIPIHRAPGAEGHEVYHPRWSNHVRYMAMSGPYRVRGRHNAIIGGGTGINIYVGRFRDDFTGIERWARVTDHDDADFFPDVWIDGGDVAGSAGGANALPDPTTLHSDSRAAGPMLVKARLVEFTEAPSLDAIKPYRSTLLESVYSIVAVERGTCDHDRIVVQHWGIRDGAYIDFPREVGQTFSLRLEPVEAHPALQGERISSTVDDPWLDVYLDVGDARR